MTNWICRVLVLIALGGCAELEQFGESGRDLELLRQQGQTGVAVLEAAPEHAVILARAREVVVEPVEDHCLDAETVAAHGTTAFVLIAGCGPDSPANAGIVTLSVSAEAATGDVAALAALVTSPAGQQLLGRSGDMSGRLIEIRTEGDAVYVLVADDGHDPVLAPRFWRGFVGINERMVLATASHFRERPVSDDVMLAFLRAQIAVLRRANGMIEPATVERAKPTRSTSAYAPRTVPLPQRKAG